MINASLNKTIKATFLQLLEDLKDKERVNDVLNALAPDEYQEMIKKLAVVYWLQKKRSNEVIKNNLGVSDKYIASVRKIMNTPGIKLAIKYMEADEWANVWANKIRKIYK